MFCSVVELELSAAGGAGEEDTGSLWIRSATLGPLCLRPGDANLVLQNLTPAASFFSTLFIL